MMRERHTPSTILIEALGLARRTTARVQDLYNRPITRERIGLVPERGRVAAAQDTELAAA